MRKGTSGSATVEVRASAEDVYDTVSDVTRIPEWSPECTRAKWLGDADGPEVGARFVGTNKRGLMRWSTRPRVVAAQRPDEFAFVMGLAGLGDLTRWTYRFEPGEEGTTRVTESFEMLQDLPKPIQLMERYLMRVPDREQDLHRNLEISLERLRHVVEARDARAGR